MPFIAISVAGPALAKHQVDGLIAETTRLMATVLGKKAELTSVAVQETPVAGWGVGGEPGTAGVRRAHLDAKVTAGTNTPAEIARFLGEADRMLRRILGSLPDATYVVVDQVPGNAWGYSGISQAARAELRQAV